ncbi:hypothetical protein ABID95_007573 [Streptomyces atratus]
MSVYERADLSAREKAKARDIKERSKDIFRR